MKNQTCMSRKWIISFMILSSTLSVSAFSSHKDYISNMKIHKHIISSSSLPSKLKFTNHQNNQIHWNKIKTSTNIQYKSFTNLQMLPSSDLIAASTSKAAGPISSVSSPIVAVSVLAFVILVHEAGHFIAARSMNINVKEFSVGVGPKIAGFTTMSKTKTDRELEETNIQTKSRNRFFFQKQKKSIVEDAHEHQDTIDFSLRLIPLGGYVQFPDNYNRTEAMQIEFDNQNEKADKKKQKKNIEEKSFQWKSLFQNKKQQQQIEAQAIIEKENNKKIWWNFKKQTNKEDTIEKTSNTKKDIVYYDDPNLLQNRPWTQRAIVLLGGIVFNLILAFTIYFGEVTIGKGLPTPMFEPGAIVRVVASKASNGAAYGVLDRGDKIIGYNGQTMTLSKATSPAVAQNEITKFINTIRSTEPGESISLSIIPSNNKGNNIQPKEVQVYPAGPIDPSTGKYLSPPTIGVSLTPNYIRTDMVHATSIANAFQLAGASLTSITTDTATSIGNAISSMISPKGGNSGGSNELSGPIGVIRMGSDIVSTSHYDIGAIAAFAAAISVNLAVVNALPLPALDGGQLVFVLLEGLAGKKVVDQKLEEEINAYALFLILLVSFSTALGDIGDIFVGR